MTGVVALYLGLLLALVGAARAIGGVAWRRRRGRRLALAGLGLAVVAALLPAPSRTRTERVTLLDRAIPTYQFWERHAIAVGTACDRAFAAVLGVTAGEIAGFQLLTAIRRLGRPGPESILNAPETLPLLEVATRTTFRELGRRAGREMVVATVLGGPAGAIPSATGPDGFRTLDPGGRAKAALGFLLQPAGADRCTVITETRVHAADAGARRRFAAYWRVIYPGSALIRRMWLRAVARRAESLSAPLR